MSNILKALRQAERRLGARTGPDNRSGLPLDLLKVAAGEPRWLQSSPVLHPTPCPESRLVALPDHDSLAAEKFRLLRTRLRRLQEKQQLKTIVVTSAVPGEGKTMVASNIALMLARDTGERVLLLEGDLRHPTLASRFGVREPRGITQWFEGDEALNSFVCRVDECRLWFLPAGEPAVEPLTILQSSKFTEGVSQLAPAFSWIIVDAPPLVPFADVHVLAASAHGLLLVIRQGQTPKKSIIKALGELDGASILGVVINDAQVTVLTDYEQYYAQKNRTRSPQRGSSDKVVS